MANWKIITLTATLAIGAAFLAITSISAAPLSPGAGGKDITASIDATSSLIEVQRWRRGRGYYYGGAGLATGLIIGGAIASQQYYSGYPYYYRPAYPAYGPYGGGDPAIAYCMQRFRSYDPYSRTYMGYDGYRHPCP